MFFLDVSELKQFLFHSQARCRLLMSEFRFYEKNKAGMVLDLIKLVEAGGDQDNPLHYYVDAAKDFNTVDDALAFLQKECPICFGLYPIHEVRCGKCCQQFLVIFG